MELKIDGKNFRSKQEAEYNEALNNDDYKALVKKLKISESEAKKNTIKLFDSLEELSHCKNCSNLYECQNKVKGYVYFPELKESNLYFSYIPCKYKKKAMKMAESKKTNQSILDSAKLKDIKITKNRTEIIKWIKDYYDKFDPYTTNKGLYLHGNFGTGKTYLIAALLNELKNKFGVNIEIVYVPELLRKLKENLSLVGDKLYYLENVSILLLDDIGAEKVTGWGRDEILGTILQTRMNSGMPTFFTSNLTIPELEKHLSLTKDNEDLVKAKRIIERIKFLTDDIELLGNNYRE
ncbi:MAG: primosomal protein DnaI [Firmicutes bacterium]|nr:primosomal protein DnaI [Bacillota bacterium]